MTYLWLGIPTITFGRPLVRKVEHHSSVTSVNQNCNCDTVTHRSKQDFVDEGIANQTTDGVITGSKGLVVRLGLGINNRIKHTSAVTTKLNEHYISRLTLLCNSLE